MRVLIVEDEEMLARAIRDQFEQEGFVADIAGRVKEAMDFALSMAYDCIVMDVMLPDGNGIEAVSDLRQGGCQTPILLLTAKNDPSDRVQGLNSGADDYLGKPFHSNELVARVYALIRRSTSVREIDTLEYGKAVLHRNSRALQIGSSMVELSSKEFALLEYLFRHPTQVMTRDKLIAHAWGPDTLVSDNALDTYIYFLRRKAQQLGFKSMIRTVRGLGYTLGPK